MYIQQIKTLYAIDQMQKKGYSDAEILSEEKRLGISFPNELKRYYKELGKNAAINRSSHTLLEFGTIYFEGEYLVLCEQEVVGFFFAIKKDDLKESNPPIYEGFDLEETGNFEWEIFYERISDFFLSIAYYNGAMGGLTYNGHIFYDENISQQAVDLIKKTRTEILYLKNIHQYTYTNLFREVIIITYEETGELESVAIGSQEKKRFDALVDIFGKKNFICISDNSFSLVNIIKKLFGI